MQTLGQIYLSQFYLVINCKITLRNDLRNVGQIFWPINTFNSNENLSAVSKLNIPYHNQYLVKSRFLFNLDNFWGLIWNQIKPLLDTFNLFFLLEDYIAHFSCAGNSYLRKECISLHKWPTLAKVNPEFGWDGCTRLKNLEHRALPSK